MVAVAQSVEQWTVTPKVVGSSPTSHPQKIRKEIEYMKRKQLDLSDKP